MTKTQQRCVFRERLSKGGGKERSKMAIVGFSLKAYHGPGSKTTCLTWTAWAENLEAARDEIIKRWGDMLYRRFRLNLWGSAEAFRSRGMDAYRVVIEHTESVSTS